MKKKTESRGQRTAQLSPAENAFLGSGAHLLGSEKLQPYSPSRIVAAQAMGLLYPQVGKEGMAQLKKTGIYPGELRDMIIVLWLCRQEKDEHVSDALADPGAAYAAAEKWAGEAGLCDMTSDVFNEALFVFQSIMNAIGESKTVRAAAEQTSAAEDEGDDPND